VLYTDGVIEARRDGDLYEDERLHAAIASRAHADAQGIADHIVADALTFQHGVARDDIAVVVLAVPAS
jgi:phosphoserine phosphatase RsbU/P